MVNITIWVETGNETYKIEEVKYIDFEDAVKYLKECLDDTPTKDKEGV